MNERYSSWAARNTPEELPLAARYQSADPIVWHGSMVYPMYTEQVGPAPTTVTLTMISAAPPAGLRGLGMGLSVVDGYLDLHGRSLAGVDAWSDALAAGVSFDVTPTAAATLVTLTPVWVDEFGTQKSWAGNYGIVVEHRPNGRVVLWCSIGEGPPNFANLVVEISTAASAAAAEPSAPAALATSPMGMASPTFSAGPPTAPTMPVPRIDAAPASSGPAARIEPPAPEPPVAPNGHRPANGHAPEAGQLRRSGSLFGNMQSSRAGRSTPETPESPLDVPAPGTPPHHGHPTPSRSVEPPVAGVIGGAPPATGILPETDGANSAPGLLVPHARAEPSAQRAVHDPRGASGRTPADPYGAFGPPVAHTHPPEDPARHTAGLLIGNPQPAPDLPPSPAPRPAPGGPHTGSGPLVPNPWTTGDSYRAFDPAGTTAPGPAQTARHDPSPPPTAVPSAPVSPNPATGRPTADGPHTGSNPSTTNPWTTGDSYPAFEPPVTPAPAQTSPPDSGPSPAESQAAPPFPNSATGRPTADGPHTGSNPSTTNPWTTGDSYPAFEPPVTHAPAQTRTTPSGAPAAEPHTVQGVDSSPIPQVPHAPPAGDAAGSPFTSTRSAESTTVAASSTRVRGTAQAPDGLTQPGERPATADASPRKTTPGQSGDPGYRGALYDLGVAMYRRGEEEQACGLWAQASEAGHAGAAYELGRVRLRRGDPVGAESWWRTAADRREPRAIAELADLLDQLGKHAEAKSWRTYAAEQQDPDVVGQSTSR
ncbi:hypothetical protein LTT66_28295 [Nocardia gipuzkoensis]|uniref:tetratricopeptide repeat protein n=1 Tax=Nocardia gipuzkoensis TaxID=2749991 RepID=UPI001E4852C1|nr:hypothetical protein [Nocardia gipuzkoensis]UGT67110.1 hypothetical protein LTT66_28295 [Nocardia gipuzkoensis]